MESPPSVKVPRYSRWLFCVAAFLNLSPGSRAAGVVINEINYHPSDSANPAEFIELWNTDATAVDVSGWQFDVGITYTLPPNTTIAANGYLVVSADPAAFAARWGFTPLGPWTGKLTNEGEQLRLRNASGATADSVTYAAGFPWPTAADGDGSSLELINPNLDHHLGSSWRSSGQPGASQQAQVYVPTNDVGWHYRKGTSEASSPVIGAWRAQGFVEDGTWLSGQASIGYGDGDDNTVLTDMVNRYSSIFMRRTFNVAAGQIPAALTIYARIDDGCIIWINGTEVARLHFTAGKAPTYNAFGISHEADAKVFETVSVPNASSFLVAGANTVAVQVFNSSLTSDDLTADVSLVAAPVSLSSSPTPRAVNSSFTPNAPPSIDLVGTFPQQPVAGQAVEVSAKVTDPRGVSAVALRWQAVDPGAYVRYYDDAYTTTWTSVPMYDDATHGDSVAGDSIYTATLPASLQTNRRLVRYRINATNATGAFVETPYQDDASPNFAYFVYNGVPDWTGAFKAGAPSTTFTGALQQSLPTYTVIANHADITNSQYNGSYNGQRFYGTLVYNGVVFDHIQFNNRGEASTYVAGKNKWRLHLNTARSLTPTDNWGRLYANPWKEITINACASPWCAVHRGMSGVEEALSLRFYELLGLNSPRSHFFHFRVIDDASETGTTQYQGGDGSGVNGGDLWGLYMAVENPDKSFLDDRGLDDGNVYEIKGGAGDERNQASGQPADGSDWNDFFNASRSNQTEAWWRANMDLPMYYSFAVGNRLIGNVDLRPGYNHCFYHPPSGVWQIVPWDLDMMFIPKSHQAGYIDQNNCLNIAPLKIEYQNRARELIDLMGSDGTANGGQIGQLIDEYAKLVAPAGVSPNWAQLDAAMWNTNTRTTSNSDAQTNHYGNFFAQSYVDSRFGGTWVRTLATTDFAGSMAYLTGYATNTFPAGSTWAVNNGDQRGYGAQYVAAEAADNAVPSRPAVAYAGPAGYPVDKLQFTPSVYTGPNAYAATQWRVGEISAPGVPLYDATRPRIYEVTDVWRSPELTANSAVTVPPASAVVGHTYRLRVRHKDVTGRWSRWSAATQFVAGAAIAAITPAQLVVSEMMYHPPALTPAESAAGYTDREQFEYIELLNISAKTLDLGGLAFTNGIAYTFASGVSLAPAARILVVKNTAAFALRYGPVASPVVGPYTGSLDNSGEEIALSSSGQIVQDFTYSDGGHPVPGQTVDPWPTVADGSGPSLVLMNPTLAPDETLVANWRPSLRVPGSPGQADLINYAEWARRYPGASAASADADGDGWSNAAEYFFGSSPLAAGERPVVAGILDPTVLSGNAPYYVFTCTHSGESGDVTYAVQFSTDMQAWAASGTLLSSATNPNGSVTERWRSPLPAGANVPRVFARQMAQFK